MSVRLTFHGAARTVTGSCMEFSLGQSRILVDCGLFQGSRSLEELNRAEPDFDPRKIDAVVLTHAHIDHSGLLPRLVAAGFSGAIFTTRETADLLEFMLADAGRIQEYEAERRNRRRDRAGEEPIAPIYTEADALAAWKLSRPVPLCEWFEPAPGFRARLWNAGHILGSASVELVADGVHILCSGDLGPDNKAFHAGPEAPEGLDHVVCESAYGDRQRDKITIEERRKLLEAEILGSQARGGNLVIPSFALERTQELLLDIARLSGSGRIGPVTVYVDSPLASRATGVFERYVSQLEDTGGRNVFGIPAIHYVQDVSESIRLNSVSGAVILAASGMCEAGRIRHHLVHNLHRRDSTILFVGFQAEGTLGRAQIRSIDSYSAHADQGELLEWIADRGPIAGSLFLDHGEAGAMEELRGLAQSRALAPMIVTPQLGETYELEPGRPARRIKTGRVERQQAVGRDWQNDYADLAVSLKRRLGAIRDKQARKEAIARMQDVLDSYADHRDKRNDRHRKQG